MAISWGGFTNHLRVGIEVWTDGYDTWTPSINVYIAYYIQVDSTWDFGDDQGLQLGGSIGGSWAYRNNLGANQIQHIGTYTLGGQGQSYGGGPTYTFSGQVTGHYQGAGPSHSVQFTLPPRPTRIPAPVGTPWFDNISASGALAHWNGSPDNGGSALDGETIHIATDPNFSNIVQDIYTGPVYGYRWIGSLLPGKQYWARAFVHNAPGWSGPSGTGTFTTLARAASAPGAPAFSGITPTGFTAAWADSTDYGGATPTSYRLQVATDSGFSSIVSDTSANNRSRAVTGLAPGTRHYARTATVNSAGTSAWSAATTVDTAARAANAPGTPTFSAVTATDATVAWADSTDYGGTPPTSYWLQVSTDPAFATGTIVYDTSQLNLSRPVTALAPGTNYYARVSTGNAIGWSPWSGVGSTTTAPFGTSGIAVSAIGPDSATVSWATPSGGTPTGYQVQYSTDSTFATGVQTVTGTTWATSQALTGLAPATTYWVRTRSNTASGYGAWSGAESFQTLSGAKVRQGGQWVDGVAYVRQGGKWVIATVYKRKNGAWVV